MKRRMLFGSLAILTMAAASLLAAGRPGVVRTLNGETFEGDITETANQVVVRRLGIETILDKARVASIDYSTYADRFDATLASLEEEDVAGRLKLAREAFDRREYALAIKAANAAVDIDPLNREAWQLQNAISAQLQLEAASRKRPATEPTADAPDEEASPARRTRGLDAQQINRVRQMELRRDDRVRIQFRNNVRKRFVDSQPNLEFRAFNSRSDVDQAFEIIEKGDAAMMDDVVIVTDPASILAFTRRLQTPLLQGCATSHCHGGTNAGRFRMMTGAPDSSMAITNFYLVNEFEQEVPVESQNSMFAPTRVPLVVRGDAQKSLLFQYALPRRKATTPHPQVKNWDGAMRDGNERLGRELVRWMNEDLVRMRSDYGFDFTLPGTPTTHPTTQPATDASDPTPKNTDATTVP